MARQQGLFNGNKRKTTKRKTTTKSKPKRKSTASTKIKVKGYTRKRGKLPARAKNGRFKKGRRR